MEKLEKVQLIVVGGGAAGMFAAVRAAQQGYSVVLLEKNEKLGKKLFITGKGRCNITNACDMEAFFHQIVTGSKFMYSSFYRFHNQDMMEWLEHAGLSLKIERGERVFPVSDKSSDVIKTLERELKKASVKVMLQTEAVRLELREYKEISETDIAEEWIADHSGNLAEQADDIRNLHIQETDVKISEKRQKKKKGYQKRIYGVYIKEQRSGKISFLPAEAVFIATGGCSYPTTGSTGDGYRFACDAGHTVTALVPSLVPLETKERFVKDMMGLALKNVSVTMFREEHGGNLKVIYSGFGEMLFTHFGVSGPLILSASSYAAGELKKGELMLSIDLKPALTAEQLDARLLRDFEQNKNKQFKHALDMLLPKTMVPVVVKLSNILPEKKSYLITREERLSLGKLLKDFRLTITGARGFEEAIITQGGVALKEINPKTMESKSVKGLYFIGEVLDLDALTGGFNLQIAWSTAAAAAAGLDADQG